MFKLEFVEYAGEIAVTIYDLVAGTQASFIIPHALLLNILNALIAYRLTLQH